MYQYDHATAVAVQPARAAAGTPGFYRNGDPGLGVPAAIVDADHLNAIQNELLNVLDGAGLSPDKNDDTQLYAAMVAIATAVASGAAGHVGEVRTKAGPTVPAGWLECDGSAVNRTTYAALFAEIGVLYGAGNGTTTFNLPDLRGEFVRGWDHGRGVDSGRVQGSTQADELKAHTHGFQVPSNFSGAGNPSMEDGSNPSTSNYNGTTASTGGTETRPRNVAMMFIIKT